MPIFAYCQQKTASIDVYKRQLQGGAASEKIASVMLTSKKPIASEKLTFTVPSDPNAAYDPSAITPKLVAKDAPATGSPISINSEHITVTLSLIHI